MDGAQDVAEQVDPQDRSEAEKMFDEIAAGRSEAPPADPQPPRGEAEPAKPAEPAAKSAEEDPVARQLREVSAQLSALSALPDTIHKLQSDLKMTAGRVSSLQSEVVKSGKAAAAAAAPGDAPSHKQIQDAAKRPEKWEALRREFPEWAEGTEALIEAKLSSFTPSASAGDEDTRSLLADLQERNSRLEQEATQTREMIVDAVHRGWKQTVTTPEFKGWYSSQPAEVRRLGSSESPSDAIELLSKYRAAESERQDAERLKAQREKRLGNASSVRGGSSGVDRKGDPLDGLSPEQQFDAIAKAKAAQRHAVR